MKILAWAIRLIIFLILFAFALQNTEPVNLRFALGQAWQAPLVMVVLAFFAAGALLGVLSLMGVVWGQRREITRLKRELGKPLPPAAVEPPSAA